MAHLYRVFGWRRHSACPRALHSQHAHWQSKLGGRPEPRGIPELLTEDCPELLKSGPFSMMECLASLFTAILNGRHPEQLSTGLITAVHKKGDKADLNNYRPITVIPVLAKLCASVLTRRLADWTERNNLRAPTQAGFRANCGTSDQPSILNYIVKKCLSQGKKLYCCLVNSEKAFDTVDREDFSKKRRLTVNLDKTEVLVFELQHTPCRDFTYGGRVLTRKDSFKSCCTVPSSMTCATPTTTYSRRQDRL
eukprot:jgi/Astpho2/7641/Aster-x1452